jgi:TPR repeat protein
LAKVHLKGLGVSKDEELATFWLRKAAEQGDEQAMKYLKQECSSSSDED